MIAANRSKRHCRALLFLAILIALIGIPSLASSATLEDSARELAEKIVAALPPRENTRFEIRNLSALPAADVARIEQALRVELQGHGIQVSSTGAGASVLVTLSENFQSLVWSGEVRKGEISQVVFVLAERFGITGDAPGAMPVTIRSEKFWEGPGRILDAAELSDGAGKSWAAVLLPDGLLIQDRRTGQASTIGIASNQSVSRDPWGVLNFTPLGNTVAIFLAPRVCTVNVETQKLEGCLPPDGSAAAPPAAALPVMIDVAPPGTPPTGKGTLIEMKPVCGGAKQFLATSARDYTQKDSLQVFQEDGSAGIALSSEINFPGPITGLHAASDIPRVVVRNLSTGNYEAYRLSFSCGQ